jgi:hypothetical protein
MVLPLVYVHVGSLPPPDYLYDNIYQVITQELAQTLVVLCNACHLLTVHTSLRTLHCSVDSVCVVSIETLALERYHHYLALTHPVHAFRDGFWQSTTARFFVLEAYMRHHAGALCHIENDVMLYLPVDLLCAGLPSDRIACVRDAPRRVIPSFIYIPTHTCAHALVDHIVASVQATFVNDMELLSSFPGGHALPSLPGGPVVFDGAAIGQYLGGVDPRNICDPPTQLMVLDNPRQGFVNETSVFKPDTCTWTRTDGRYWCGSTAVANLHIHSKQLYQFSSQFDLQFQDVVTGDRVVSLCDAVLALPENLAFHQGLGTYAKSILDPTSPSFHAHLRALGSTPLRLFVYTHCLDQVFPLLDPSLEYILYTHNSDHPFNHTAVVEAPWVRAVYAQNVDIASPKVSLLPIGVANAMWSHGNLIALYETMRQTYHQKKPQRLYINLSPATYVYRRDVLQAVAHFPQASTKPYKEYLAELATHQFCLCVRGNGIDTHRFWEALYLGVVPVIINNDTTACQVFVDALRTHVPFVEITENDLGTIPWDRLLTPYTGPPIQCLPALKLSTYRM